MKKIFSFMLAAAMGAASLSTFSCAAAGETDVSNKGIVIFGDSIAAGYGLDPAKEYNYGQICADYLGCDVANYAVSGDTTYDMLDVIGSLSDAERQSLEDSGIVVISIGGNDIMHYMSKYLINYAAKNNFLNEGYTADNLPEDPNIGDLMKIVNIDGKGGLLDYAKSGVTAMLELNSEFKKMTANLRFSSNKYEGIIQNQIIPNIEEAVAEIKEITPGARVIVQTIYQPVQFTPEYVNDKFGSGSSYETFISLLRSNLRDVMDTFKTELEGVEGIEIADVYYQFTSVDASESQNNNNPGHAQYFVNIQKEGDERDIHPNQKGHLAIAAEILNVIGDLHNDSGLFTQIYKGLGDSSSYPLIALDTYKTVAGNIITGDINFDDKIDARDASLALKEYANLSGGNKSMLSSIQKSVSDVNNDTLTDSRDASMILKYYAYVSSGGRLSLSEFMEQGQ